MAEILAISGGRADWGLLEPVLRAIRDAPDLNLALAVTGQHLAEGSPSLASVEDEGFSIDHRVEMLLASDSDVAVTKSIGIAVIGFADLYRAIRPDLLVILGDRYEILAAAVAAQFMNIPVAHLCGGDLTEGAVDDALRHAITKLSHLHFVTNAAARRRVIQLGEQSDRVFDVGSPGLDRIREIDPITRDRLFAILGLPPRVRLIVSTFHPVTRAGDSERECSAMLDALARFHDVALIFTASNADPGHAAIDSMLRDFATQHKSAVFVPSLGSERYVSALTHANAIVGNSSSGLYEAPSFGIATINIGARQDGRLRAASVTDVAPEANLIEAAIRHGLESDFSGVENPCGDGRSAGRIVEMLSKTQLGPALLRKRFRDWI